MKTLKMLSIEPKAFSTIVKELSEKLDFTVVGIARLSGDEFALDMLKFKVIEYLDKENDKQKPDVALKWFDFDIYCKNHLTPIKNQQIDAQGHLSIADNIKHMFSIVRFSNEFNMRIHAALASAMNDHNPMMQFFTELNKNKDITQEELVAFKDLLVFARDICLHSQQNKMDAPATAKMMASTIWIALEGYTENLDKQRLFNQNMQTVLEALLKINAKAVFDEMLHIQVQPKKASSEPSLWFGKMRKKKDVKQTSDYSKPEDELIDAKPLAASYPSTPDSGFSSGSASSDDLLNQSGDNALLLNFERLTTANKAQDSKCQVPLYKTSKLQELIRHGDVSGLDAYIKARKSADEEFSIDSVITILKRTLLHEAALAQQPEIIDLLRKYGASIQSLDSQGRTPLHYAASWPKLERSFDQDSLDALLRFDGAIKIDGVQKLAKNNGMQAEFDFCAKVAESQRVKSRSPSPTF